MSMCVATPVGDSLVVDQVYLSCVISTMRFGFDTRENLVLLDMVDFDLILSMNWLSHLCAILDCYSKVVILYMLDIPSIIWTGAASHTPSGMISFLKVQRMVEKGCLAYFAYACLHY